MVLVAKRKGGGGGGVDGTGAKCHYQWDRP